MSEMKNTLVSIYGKSTSKHDNIAIRAIQKDTHRKESFRKMARALVSYGAHSNSLIHVQLQSQNLGVGREDKGGGAEALSTCLAKSRWMSGIPFLFLTLWEK